MLLRIRVQEPGGDQGQGSRTPCLLLGNIGEADDDPRHKVISRIKGVYQNRHAHVTRWLRNDKAQGTLGRNSPGVAVSNTNSGT